jgi:hypothetical protein
MPNSQRELVRAASTENQNQLSIGALVKPKQVMDVVRPLSLLALASGLFISLLFLNVCWVDELASKRVLSDKSTELYRHINILLVAQWLLQTALICGLEIVIAKKREARNREFRPQAGQAQPETGKMMDRLRGKR